jgi:hypothetical protein
MTVDVKPPAPAGTTGSDSDAAVAYVRDLQRDGRLLLHYVARRVDRPLGIAGALSGGAAGGGGLGAGPGGPFVLTADPAPWSPPTGRRWRRWPRSWTS